MNFIIFVIILVIVYLAIPPLYKFIVFERMINSLQAAPGMTANQVKAERTRSIDWTIFFLFIIFIALLALSNPKLTIIYIIYGITFLAMSMMLIISEKNSNPLWKNILDYSNLQDWKNNFGADIGDFFKTAAGILIYPFYKIKDNGPNEPNKLGLTFVFLSCLLITLCVILIPAGKDGEWIEKNGVLYSFLIASSIAISGLFEFIMF